MKLTILLALVLSISAFSQREIVYGEDNRVDWYESTNTMYRELAMSTAAMIDKKKISITNKTYTLDGKKLGSYINACNNVRFKEQITAASCSGFLVGEDLLVTAGHCIKNESDCNKYSWVFDYKLDSSADKADQGPVENVYNCKSIIERKLSSFWGKNDYALIKLDRKTDRKALEYNIDKVSDNAELVVIGHPTGLPQKIADGATVRSTSGKYFTANLDTFGGNSGSAVFNAKTGVVEGILVRGDQDYIQRADGCRDVNTVANDGGRGEEVTYIKNIKKLSGRSGSWWPF